MTITLINIIEDVKTALYTTFSYYFVGGNTLSITSESVTFADCELFYNIQQLDVYDGSKPAIGIVGARQVDGGEKKRMKCWDGMIVRYVEYISLRRTLFVKVLGDRRTLADGTTSADANLAADEVWSQIMLIINTQMPKFEASGIYIPNLSFPVKRIGDVDENDQETVLAGEFSFQIRVPHYVDELVI